MDVFPDVFAYGILLVPKDIKPGERRPVVVCQHGLEGRPQDVLTGRRQSGLYTDSPPSWPSAGFITFAPQNLYIFKDRFRTLQRKANPLGRRSSPSSCRSTSRSSTGWARCRTSTASGSPSTASPTAASRPCAIPPLVKNYCLSICSADFNEWVWKNASTRSPLQLRLDTGEYEIFEFDLGNTFNYAEMAALIAPRPFMVERGHFDGVAPDETVAYEFAKVRFLYKAKLGIGDRCEIEWFAGPHTIHGVGTFEFLHKHLRWPGSK